MSRPVVRLSAGLLLALSAGCALVPPEPVVTGPTSATPPLPAPPAARPNGSIYQPRPTAAIRYSRTGGRATSGISSP
ncbi:flagellar basal body L-ring protein [Bordetella trematum]|nr:flagellar basal body L-ring protein [Bordetella trematum]